MQNAAAGPEATTILSPTVTAAPAGPSAALLRFKKGIKAVAGSMRFVRTTQSTLKEYENSKQASTDVKKVRHAKHLLD